MTAGFKYRPLTDVWILARTQNHYYGGYPGGFYWRARALLPGKLIHLCSGKVAQDFTVDINPDLEPDLVADARSTGLESGSFDAVLLDPPYTAEDAKEYNTDYPEPKDLMREAYRLVRPGGRVGLLHYIVPRPPAKDARLLAMIGIVVGFGNRVRIFTVFEKPDPEVGENQTRAVLDTPDIPLIPVYPLDDGHTHRSDTWSVDIKDSYLVLPQGD